MTITTTTSVVVYDGDGLNLIFPYTFKTIDALHLTVLLDGIVIAPGDTIYPYTISGIGDAAGGDVQFTLTAPPLGEANVSIIRKVPDTQEVDYQPFDDFPAETHEAALDKLTMLAQQLNW